MSTLKREDHDILDKQRKAAGNQMISKAEVLEILHNKLKERDEVNTFIVDRIDVVALKEVINQINQLEP